MIKERSNGKCKQCGSLEYISRNRLCIKCSTDNQLEQQRQLKAKKGPYYDEWRQKIREATEKA